MTSKGLVRAALLMAAAVMLSGQTRTQTRNNWDAEVVETAQGHRVGNPEAKVKLVEFFSYTCPHCAEFARDGEGALKLGHLATGKVSLEYRHLIRDPVDLTVGMLVNCGAPAKFAGNHSAFILSQSRWIGPLARPTQEQMNRWRAPGATGRRAIASAFGFYTIMERRGYSRTNADRCLADQAMARRLAEISDREWKRPGIGGTPSFAINGIVMPGTHTWAALERQLREFL